ncbi:protein SPT2 homolog [Paramormyrops kingsleyae]|uniref:Protein SPT2 homolog n=1 Tax=Paramormyrops kingsleyae TaxID=1676925 RepID=A0A3B3R6M4_9TELE|nr:protein SPT2 homolog [Paramormyrops kingsleyae]
MDFENILTLASENQGLSALPTKRYSLQAGPAKKHPKVKGVESAAVQAFLKKKEMEQKKKEMQSKKQKDELLAKRVELKSDRKARAMASRTKDNFRGYNGIPVVDQPKKRHPKGHPVQQSKEDFVDDEDNYEYSQTDSEPELEPQPQPQLRNDKSLAKSSGRPSGPGRPVPPPMNFEDLLKLAQKKQFEPVELKPKKKSEERLRTAEELRELELERKAKRQDRGREAKPEREHKPQGNPSTSKKCLQEKDARNGKSHRSSSEKLPHRGSGKKPTAAASGERPHGIAKPSQGDKHVSSTSSALNSKITAKASSQAPNRPQGPRPFPGQKPVSSSDLMQKRGNPPVPPGKTSGSGTWPGVTSSPAPTRTPAMGQTRPGAGGSVRPSPGSEHTRSSVVSGISKQVRPSQGNSGKMTSATSARSGTGEPIQSARFSDNGQMRSGAGGPPRSGIQPQARPGGSSQVRPSNGGICPPANGPGRPWSGAAGPANNMGSGPGRPKCTVVAETISSKNVAPRPGMPSRLPPGHRPVMRPPGTMLPPITSSYKRKYEEEDYDPEMDDFIDDGGVEQDEISKHIREIFGYDRNKYQEESDYALRFMESSWKEQQKEEARSLRMGIKEDEEDIMLEEEERKRKLAAVKAKRKKM